MNIKVEKLIINRNFTYKLLSIDKCCDTIANSKSISINTQVDKNNPNFDYKKPEYSAKIYKCYDENDKDWYLDYYEKISFCPFCGKPIMIDIINERDVTEEYYKLRKELKKIKGLLLKTDIKSENDMLKEKLSEIQCKIRDLTINDEFLDERNNCDRD